VRAPEELTHDEEKPSLAAAIAAACACRIERDRSGLDVDAVLGASFGGNLDTSRTAYGATLGFTAGGFGFDVDFGVTPNFFGKKHCRQRQQRDDADGQI
jgi:hypothetical protein